MKMNWFLRLCFAVILLVSGFLLCAQQAPPPPAAGKTVTEEQVIDANVQLMRQNLRAKRKEIIAANLPLTADEATKFWPVYDQYVAETIKVNDDRYALIKDYAQTYDTMTHEQASAFIRKWLALDQQNTELRLKFVPEFEKVITGKKVARFFEVDRRVGMMIELKVAGQVPLVTP